MKNFYLEDGCFYCNKDDGNELHETHIEIRTLTGYDVEYGRIQKPSIINRLKDNYLYLVCSCGEIEDISDEFIIDEDGYIVEKENKVEKIICKKDWYIDGQLGYKAGNKYNILEKDDRGNAKCVLLDSDIIKFRGWFWSGSNYFDVDSVFNEEDK